MFLEKSLIKLEYVGSTGQDERKGSGPSVQGEWCEPTAARNQAAQEFAS